MPSSLPESALIIGSGIGGLSTAIILAQLGVKVTVLEKNSHPGGLMRSYKRKGFSCEVGVHYLGSLDKGQVLRKFFDYLGVTDTIEVKRMGDGGVIDRYIFASPSSPINTFDLPIGFDSLENHLCVAFPDERASIRSLMGPIRQAAQQLHNLDLLYAPLNDFSLLDQSEPYGKVLDSIGCSPGLRSVLAIAASWIGVPLDDCPAYYHNMALASYVSSSYRLEGSGAEMANAFSNRFKALGGTIITSAEVDQIQVESRQVKGVHLTSGELLEATAVIGAIHPMTVLRMLPQDAVKPSYRKRITGLTNTHGIFSLHAAVNSNLHPEIPYNIFNISTEPTGEIKDLCYYQIRKSTVHGKNVLSILTSGHNKLWDPWKKTTTGKRSPDYVAQKEHLASSLLRESEKYLGDLNDAMLLDTYTPLTLRDWVNSPEGSAYGVLRSSSQILGTALLNRTAITGLYLAGQNVMAPGIIGTIMGSFSTVKLLIGAERFARTIHL